MSKRARPLNIARLPGAWPPTCMTTSCHYADALYSVGYTAARKDVHCTFSADGCSSVDDAASLLQWSRITTRQTGNSIQSTIAWRAWLGGRCPSPKCLSGRMLRSHPRLPSTSLAWLGLPVLRVCFVSSSLVGSWPCTIAEAAELMSPFPVCSQPRPLPTYTILIILVLTDQHPHLMSKPPLDIVDGRAWSSIVGSQLLFPLTATSRVRAPASQGPPQPTGKSMFIDLVM
jgi:hypothetical protein